MPRDVQAYLSDIVDACRAIEAAVSGHGFAALSHVPPRIFDAISKGRRIVYDALVWAIVTNDVALLRKESASLLVRLDIQPSEPWRVPPGTFPAQVRTRAARGRGRVLLPLTAARAFGKANATRHGAGLAE